MAQLVNKRELSAGDLDAREIPPYEDLLDTIRDIPGCQSLFYRLGLDRSGGEAVRAGFDTAGIYFHKVKHQIGLTTSLVAATSCLVR